MSLASLSVIKSLLIPITCFSAYLTGGVRCERASAYLREKGTEYSDVFQLEGGSFGGGALCLVPLRLYSKE